MVMNEIDACIISNYILSFSSFLNKIKVKMNEF